MITGVDIGKDLIEALGLPKNTISFVLRVKGSDLITVECEYCPDNGDFIPVLAEYALVRIEPVAHVESDAFDFDDWMRARKDAAHSAFMAIRHAA